jgi:glycosyltransferase 2 family protein
MKRKIRTILIISFSLSLLVLVIGKVGVRELYQTMKNANLYWVVLSICLEPLLIWVSAKRWQILIESQGYRVSLVKLNALYLIGRFFNNFLPSNVGGDVIRGYELSKDTKNLSVALASVFVDRFTGFVMLVFLALIAFITHYKIINDIRFSVILVFSVIILFFILWLVLDKRILSVANRIGNVPLLRDYLPKINKLHANIYDYKGKNKALTLALFWSFLFMVLAILNVYTSARAFHDSISLIEIATIVPVIMIVAMVPFTLNGLGLEEWAYVLLFSWFGLPETVGLSTIVMVRSKSLILALFGGLLYPLIRLSSKEDILERETQNPPTRPDVNILP